MHLYIGNGMFLLWRGLNLGQVLHDLQQSMTVSITARRALVLALNHVVLISV